MSRVPVEPFKERGLELNAAGVSWATMATRMGWTNRKGNGASERIKRTLGLESYSPGHGYPLKIRAKVSQQTAVRLCEALDLDPLEIGL